MPSHPDAVGYLQELATEVSLHWFTCLVDYTINHGAIPLAPPRVNQLLELFMGKGVYTGSATISTTGVGVVTSTAPADRLQRIFDFTNFKKLSNTLDVTFEKPITILFGMNGSGKSSLCEAFKVLANSDAPKRPLRNVRTPSSAPTGFQYQFAADQAPRVWNSNSGHGLMNAKIKYFDTSVALRNVRVAVEPNRIIEVTPFKLNLFEALKTHVNTLRNALLGHQADNKTQLAVDAAAARQAMQDFVGSPAQTFAEADLSAVTNLISIGESAPDLAALAEKVSEVELLEKASSPEGLAAVRTEAQHFSALLADLLFIDNSASAAWTMNFAQARALVAAKIAEQQTLASALLPKGARWSELLSLLGAASLLCAFENAAGHACPLCSRPLGEREVELFARYYELLNGQLEKDINALQRSLATASSHLRAIADLNLAKWDQLHTLPADLLGRAKEIVFPIKSDAAAERDPATDLTASLRDLKHLASELRISLDAKNFALSSATVSHSSLLATLTQKRVEKGAMGYACRVADNLAAFRNIKTKMDIASFYLNAVAIFAPLLMKITNKAKSAHTDLVVTDFETRLNAEYLSLAEKDMGAFGVRLAQRGSDATVTMLPQVGGEDISEVLSEGEQTIHALALFFAELETCSHCVLVFDDPITSFDYDYTANFSSRLAAFAKRFPHRQVIVLTHNWECFVQLQLAMDRAGLDTSVQVLEGCRQVNDYSEKFTDLKAQILTLLNVSGEPSDEQKEQLAGKMRRLIETVVNTRVFVNLRHQFKHRRFESSSDFRAYTRVTPLTAEEAHTLKELFAKLSPAEHDDPTNDYVNTDKAMFKTRFNHILAVDASIHSRNPPPL